MSQGRIDPVVAVLPSGRVLVAGGYGPVAQGGYGPLASVEIYDPATGLFAATGSMSVPRWRLTATSLADGQILIVGGSDASFSALDTAEIYDPATGAFTALEARLTRARSSHTATLLPGGDVLIAGGCQSFSCPHTTAERFDAVNQARTADATGSRRSPSVERASPRLRCPRP
jgi:hypothetical protein